MSVCFTLFTCSLRALRRPSVTTCGGYNCSVPKPLKMSGTPIVQSLLFTQRDLVQCVVAGVAGGAVCSWCF